MDSRSLTAPAIHARHCGPRRAPLHLRRRAKALRTEISLCDWVPGAHPCIIRLLPSPLTRRYSYTAVFFAIVAVCIYLEFPFSYTMSYPRFTQGLRSPFDTTSVRRDSVTSEMATRPSSSKMLRIQNLLNPEMPSTQPKRSTSPPPTPASIANNSTAASTPCPDTPQTPESKGKKPAKDDTAFVRGCPQGDIKFEPFECGTYSTILTASENAELKEQHVRFQLYPSGGETGLIREFPKHIPYASAKKGFFVKTGREAFEGA